MTVQTCSKCGIPKLLNNFVKPDGQAMKWCCECRNRNGERSAAGRRRTRLSEQSNPNRERPPIPDRVVDFNAMPTPRKLTTYRGG